MNGKYFVDTNVLVYAHDNLAGVKQEIAQRLIDDLWASRSAVISTQVLQEFASVLRRKPKPPFTCDEVRQLIRNYRSWEVVANDANSVLEALALEDRYKVSFWDALILQAAESAGVDVLLSEDLAAGQSYGTFRVENPFVNAAEH